MASSHPQTEEALSSDNNTSGDEPLDPEAEAALLKQLTGLLKETDAPGKNTPKASAASGDDIPPAPASLPAVDKDLIKELAALLTETGLSEIEISSGGLRVARAPAVQSVAVAAPAAGAPAAIGEPSKADSAAEFASYAGAVISPMVGTAYLAPEPGAAPFVLEGDQVKEGQTLLIVEAMKTMNPIPAPKSGTVSRVLVSDGQPVEYGEPLLLIE